MLLRPEAMLRGQIELENLPPEITRVLRDEKLAYLTTVGRRTGKPHTVELCLPSRAGGYLSAMRANIRIG